MLGHFKGMYLPLNVLEEGMEDRKMWDIGRHWKCEGYGGGIAWEIGRHGGEKEL